MITTFLDYCNQYKNEFTKIINEYDEDTGYEHNGFENVYFQNKLPIEYSLYVGSIYSKDGTMITVEIKEKAKTISHCKFPVQKGVKYKVYFLAKYKGYMIQAVDGITLYYEHKVPMTISTYNKVVYYSTSSSNVTVMNDTINRNVGRVYNIISQNSNPINLPVTIGDERFIYLPQTTYFNKDSLYISSLSSNKGELDAAYGTYNIKTGNYKHINQLTLAKEEADDGSERAA
jgi:hypothetical protein